MDENELNTLFLGTGWSFPPTFEKGNNQVKLVSAVTDINQSLSILLGTTLGERLMHPDFGCNLSYYLHQPLSTSLTTFIKDLIETAIVRHEARIDLLNVKINLAQQYEGVLLIEIDYNVRATNARSNYVYPYYLTEGTNTEL